MNRKQTPPDIEFILAVQRVLSAADTLKLSIERMGYSPPRREATARPSDTEGYDTDLTCREEAPKAERPRHGSPRQTPA